MIFKCLAHKANGQDFDSLRRVLYIKGLIIQFFFVRLDEPIRTVKAQFLSAQLLRLVRGLRDKELNNPVLIFVGIGEPIWYTTCDIFKSLHFNITHYQWCDVLCLLTPCDIHCWLLRTFIIDVCMIESNIATIQPIDLVNPIGSAEL